MKHAAYDRMQKARAAVLIPNDLPSDIPVDSPADSPADLPAPQNAGDLFKLAAAKHNLTLTETLLMAVCECALRTDVEHIAAVCAQARVSDDQIQLHGSEIGADKHLRPAMVQNIRKFVQFFRTLERLNIVEFYGTIENRTLLGHKNIKIVDKQKWTSVIHFACDTFAYFGSKITVYERLLDFGYGPVKYNRRAPKTDQPSVPKTPTQKKINMLLHNPHWMFFKDRLDRNVKRYTNGHVREKPLSTLARLALQRS